MPIAAVRDIDVYYEIHGTGPRVVLINGTGADLRQNPARDRDLLTRHHEVLMYDQRGLGRSGKPDRAYTMADYADDCAALMDHVGWDRAHVIGISFGGMVAQHVALAHPARVDRLVLACTSAGGDGGSSFDLLAVHDLPLAERNAVVFPIMDTRNDLSTDPPTLAPLFELLIETWGKGTPLNADDPAWAMGARRQLEARAHHDVWERLAGPDPIAAPTFAIGGRFDAQAPPENVERLASRIPDAELAFFDGGHLFLLQDRAAWPAVIDFLAR
jgi:3-oxoadipate enol-lactonase